MTFLEKVKQLKPSRIENSIIDSYCPIDFDLEESDDYGSLCREYDNDCTLCWNREYPIPPKEATETIEPIPHDPVNHPSHYTTGMECIEEIITVFGKEVAAHFCLGNVWKYRKRALHKNGIEDLDKSDWYMNKYHELMTELAGGCHGE